MERTLKVTCRTEGTWPDCVLGIEEGDYQFILSYSKAEEKLRVFVFEKGEAVEEHAFSLNEDGESLAFHALRDLVPALHSFVSFGPLHVIREVEGARLDAAKAAK